LAFFAFFCDLLHNLESPAEIIKRKQKDKKGGADSRAPLASGAGPAAPILCSALRQGRGQ